MFFSQPSPKIVLGYAEHHELMVLAITGGGHTADASDDLNYELDRAHVVPDSSLPSEVIRMGSLVTYRSGDGSVRTVTLVYPAQTASSTDALSILTPVGTALIGLSVGQTISWMDRNGADHRLTVVSVVNRSTPTVSRYTPTPLQP